MHLLQNLKQKSVARKSMVLLAAITLSAAVATNALAAGHGGGGGLGGGGGFGGGHVGGGFGGGHVGGGGLGGGGGFGGGHIGGGGGFAAGHIGGGSAGGRIVGDRPGGHGDAYLGNRGVDNLHGTHMGGDLYARDHDRDHHFRDRFVVVPGYDGYYDAPSYPYDDSYSTPQVVVPEAQTSAPACQHSEQTVKVPSENGGTAQVTILRC